MSRSSTLLWVTVILALCFHCFVRGAVSWGSTAPQADQELKYERFKVKCSLARFAEI